MASARSKFEGTIPYTDEQLIDAIKVSYESRNGDGRDDPEIEFDDDKLAKPKTRVIGQASLPGIPDPPPSEALTADMRETITDALVSSFNDRAESDASDVDPPDYLGDDLEDYQRESWTSRSEREKYRWALDNGYLDDIEYGQGKFVGSSKEDGTDAEVRRDAQSIYQESIRSFAAGQSSGQDIGAAWAGLRKRWSALRQSSKDVKGRFARSGDHDAKLRMNRWAVEANTKFKNIEDVKAVALQNQRALQAAGQEVADKIGGGIVFKRVGTKITIKDTAEFLDKGIARVETKAKTRGLGGVTDVVRIGYIVKTPEQVQGIVDGLREHFEVINEGYQTNQWGYYDAKALVRFDNGMIGEVQIMEHNLERAKSSKGEGAGHGHELYDAGRELPVADPKRQELMAKSQKVYLGALAKAGPAWRAIYERAPLKPD